ncbi:MAG: hypothetical protein JWQ11_4850 [Rhizobacter sp.]|nr:hypothetical protein [Rhizobacter sp.]
MRATVRLLEASKDVTTRQQVVDILRARDDLFTQRSRKFIEAISDAYPNLSTNQAVPAYNTAVFEKTCLISGANKVVTLLEAQAAINDHILSLTEAGKAEFEQSIESLLDLLRWFNKSGLAPSLTIVQLIANQHQWVLSTYRPDQPASLARQPRQGGSAAGPLG